MATLSDLPEDVVAKIFSFLPAKSVLRLKSVQKSWNTLVNALVENPSFVAEHLYNSTNNRPTSSSFIFNSSYRKSGSYISDKKLTLLTLHHHHDGDDAEVELNEIPNQVNALVERQLVIFTHCDGMVCMVDPYATTVELRNPVTGYHKLLPSPGFSSKPPAWIEDIFAGFGYDALCGTYKIIVAYKQYGSNFVAKVCTLGENKWREVEISTVKVGPSDNFTGSGLCCEGVCYWLASVGHSKQLLFFDMHSEKFDAMPLPAVRVSLTRIKLFRLRDSLAISFDPVTHRRNPPVCVWMMSLKDKNWTEHHKLAKIDRIGKLRGFLKAEHEIIMLGRPRADRGLITYNVAQKKRRRICEGKTIDSAHLIPYVDSFLTL